MRYFDEHRRKLIKQNTLNTIYTESGVATLNNTAGLGINKLEIQGNTFQQTYEGYNLFDIESAEIINGKIDGNIIEATGAIFVDIPFPVGEYTISFERNADFNVWLVNGRVSVGYFEVINVTDTMATFSYDATYDGFLRIKWFGAGNKLSNIQIVKATNEDTEVKSYEPYVGGMISPSPDYPQNIVNTGDNGLELKLSGEDFEPQTVTISSEIVLGGLGEYRDTLTINRATNTVKKYQSIISYTLTGYESIVLDSDGTNVAYIVELPYYKKADTPYLCTHFIPYTSEITELKNVVEIVDNKAWFYNPTVDDFVEFLKENSVQIAFVHSGGASELDYSRENFARELFMLSLPYGQDALLEASGEVAPSKISAEYYTLNT